MHVLIVGSGIAGLTAALRADAAGHRVTVVTKAAIADSNTRHAQGGIAAAWFADDSAASHAADTVRAGAGLAEGEAVRVLCEGGPAAIRALIDAGVSFDRATDAGSQLARGLEAAHSVARVLHAGGDATGAAIEAALVASVRSRRIEVHEHTMLVDLLLTRGASVVGVEVQGKDGVRRTIAADAVLLATGGAGQLFRHTTNPAIATGDGVAAAWRAGARLRDLEFYQFHPTALAQGDSFLVSEAVRGEGAVLRNAAGERFMLGVHPAAELAPRDVVARAIAVEMAAQDGRPVLLDATALERELLARRFPTITRATRAAQLDWARTPIPVTPAAHYWMGGVATDTEGRTSLPGLYAIGEVARSGVHGANRLASNSLLEGAVFAARAVDALSRTAGRVPSDPARPVYRDHDVSTALVSMHPLLHRGHSTGGMGAWTRGELQQLMWDSCGLHRTGAQLELAAATLARWRRPDTGAGATMTTIENANLLDLARLTVAAANSRTESSGAHFRIDASAAHVTPAASITPTVSAREDAIAC